MNQTYQQGPLRIFSSNSNYRTTLHPRETTITCSGCGTVSTRKKAIAWVFFNYKHLDPIDVCPPCSQKLAPSLQQMQVEGL